MSQAQSHVSLFLTCSALSVFITPTAMSPMVFNVGMVHTSFPSCAFRKAETPAFEILNRSSRNKT